MPLMVNVPLFYVPPKRNTNMLFINLWVMTDSKKHLDCGDVKTKSGLSEKHLHVKHIPLNNMRQLAVHPPTSGTGISFCLLLSVPPLLLSHLNFYFSWSSPLPVSVLSFVFLPSLFYTTTILHSFPHLYIFKYAKEC